MSLFLPLSSFSCITSVDRTSSASLNRSGENRYLSFVFKFRKKASSLSLLSMMQFIRFCNHHYNQFQNNSITLNFPPVHLQSIPLSSQESGNTDLISVSIVSSFHINGITVWFFVVGISHLALCF